MSTFSPLISGTVKHNGKYSSRQGRAVVRTIDHHWAGTGTGGRDSLVNPRTRKSANYIIMDGKIYGQVPEEYRAWTSGSFAADAPAITLEIQNSSGRAPGKGDSDPNSWKISAANLAAAARLKADIAKRHGWGDMASSRTRYHRQFAQTSCPGGYLWANRAAHESRSRSEYNKLMGKKDTNGTSSKPSTARKTDWQLASEVLDGVHGNGDARRKSLGSRYAAVQKVVNQRLGQVTSPKTNKPVPQSRKTVGQLADEVMAGVHGNGSARKRSLGNRYTAVQREVNRRLAGSTKPTKSISQLADEVLQGLHGNGSARKRSLGNRYAEVQREVNRRLR